MTGITSIFKGSSFTMYVGVGVGLLPLKLAISAHDLSQLLKASFKKTFDLQAFNISHQNNFRTKLGTVHHQRLCF